MTAYGQALTQTELGELSCELRSVNHRFLDVAPKLPDELRPFEGDLREAIAAKLARGRVDCFVRLATDQAVRLQLNQEMVQELESLTHQIKAAAPSVAALRAIDILRWPGVLQSVSADQDKLRAQLMAVLDEALNSLCDARQREGSKMADLIRQRLVAMQGVLNEVQVALPEIEAQQHQRLQDKLAEFAEQMDPQRIEQEMLILLNKADVAEELDRLHVHVAEINRILTKPEPAGRRLDFLMQELNREANTLGSKSNDARITKASVDLKVLIEQMREQIQNIE